MGVVPELVGQRSRVPVVEHVCDRRSASLREDSETVAATHDHALLRQQTHHVRLSCIAIRLFTYRCRSKKRSKKKNTKNRHANTHNQTTLQMRFLPARLSKQCPCYGNVSGWVAGWLAGCPSNAGIVSKEQNLSENFFDHLKASF